VFGYCFRDDAWLDADVADDSIGSRCGNGCDSMSKEKVNHPSHYNQGKIEVIDAIEDWDLNFCEGNVIKYVARHRHKAEPLEDLKKAKWYLERLIDRIEDESR